VTALDAFLASNFVWSLVVAIALQLAYALLMAWLVQRTLMHLQREQSKNTDLAARLSRAELLRDSYRLKNAKLTAELKQAAQAREWVIDEN